MDQFNQSQNSMPSSAPSPNPSVDPAKKMSMKPRMSKNTILLGIAVLAILVTGVLVLSNSNPVVGSKLSFLNGILPSSANAIAKKAVDHLNSSVLQAGSSAELVSASKQSGVVKMSIKVTTSSGTNTYDSYATLDGKLLFPEALALGGATTGSPTGTPATQATPASVAKVDNTMLDAYVVSGCPYGIQVQRALSNAIKTSPALANYVTVRYIGAVSGNTITAMHGDEEAKENLRQICIREEQPTKYWSYVDCYIKKAAGTAANGMPYGDTKTCQTQAGIDTAKLNACVADPARGLTFAKEDFALNTQYNVSGSPTLILNGATIDETSFGGRSADAFRNIVCSSSINPPEFCSKTLDTTPASTSFSLTYAGAGGATAAANNNCAPVVQ